MLETVYYGSAAPVADGREKNFTAFAMYYKDEFYLITAGHCIEYDDIKYTDFKFKSNTESAAGSILNSSTMKLTMKITGTLQFYIAPSYNRTC